MGDIAELFGLDPQDDVLMRNPVVLVNEPPPPELLLPNLLSAAANGEVPAEVFNKRGQLAPGQKLNDYLSARSDVHRLAFEAIVDYRRTIGNMTPESPGYKEAYVSYQRRRIEASTKVFLTSSKIPETFLKSREWFRKDKPCPDFYEEKSHLDLDFFGNIIQRQNVRLKFCYRIHNLVPAWLFLLASHASSTFEQNLSLNVCFTGNHSTGKTYIAKSIGETLPEGMFVQYTKKTANSSTVADFNDVIVTYIDEMTGAIVGADPIKAEDQDTATLKNSLTSPIIVTEFCHHQDGLRTAVRVIGTRYGSLCGSHNGKQPDRSSPTWARFFPVAVVDHTSDSPNSIVNLALLANDPNADAAKEEQKNVMRLTNFYVMLMNYYIYTGAMKRTGLHAFQFYFSRFKQAMEHRGMSFPDVKKLRQMELVARMLTVHSAVVKGMMSPLYASERHPDNRTYIKFFDDPLPWIRRVEAHNEVTRSVFVFAMTLCAPLWGETCNKSISIAARFLAAVGRDRIPLAFHDSCYTACRNADPASVHEGASEASKVAYEFRRQLEAPAVEQSPSSSTTTPTARAPNNQMFSEDNSFIVPLEIEDIDLSNGMTDDLSNSALPYGSVLSHPLQNEAGAARAVDACEKTGIHFHRAFSKGNPPRIDPNYVELTGTVGTVLSLRALAEQIVQQRAATHRFSAEAIENALDQLSKTELLLPQFRFDEETGKVCVVPNLPHKRMRVLKVENDSALNNSDGLSNPYMKHVYIVSHCLLHDLRSTNDLLRDSIAALGFDHAIPGRFLTALPSYVLQNGKKGKRRVLAEEIFDVIRIDVRPGEKFIWVNSDPLNSDDISFLSDTFITPNSATNQYMPPPEVSACSLRIVLEPEIVAIGKRLEEIGMSDQIELFNPLIFENMVAKKRCEAGGIALPYPKNIVEAFQRNNVRRIAASRASGDAADILPTNINSANPQFRISREFAQYLLSISDEHAHALLNDQNGNQRQFDNSMELSQIAQSSKRRRTIDSAEQQDQVRFGSAAVHSRSMSLFSSVLSSEQQQQQGVFRIPDPVEERRRMRRSEVDNSFDNVMAMSDTESLVQSHEESCADAN